MAHLGEKFGRCAVREFGFFLRRAQRLLDMFLRRYIGRNCADPRNLSARIRYREPNAN